MTAPSDEIAELKSQFYDLFVRLGQGQAELREIQQKLQQLHVAINNRQGEPNAG